MGLSIRYLTIPEKRKYNRKNAQGGVIRPDTGYQQPIENINPRVDNCVVPALNLKELRVSVPIPCG
jgi:hypothetical protein